MSEKVLPLNIVVSKIRGQPILELRQIVRDPDLFKLIIKCAYDEKPIVAYPRFRDKFFAASVLEEKGIIYKEGEEYFFKI